MTIYCDESGGLNAGAMTFSAVMLTPKAAADIHARFRGVTGLRGELKGSRISLVRASYDWNSGPLAPFNQLLNRAGSESISSD